MFGDSLTTARLAGDGWQRRHDTIKKRISRILSWNNVQHKVEVFNMFVHLIPQEGLSRMEVGRKRQGLVPDFKIYESPVPGRLFSAVVLAELKK